MSASNIQVAIKVRPILRKETEQDQASSWKVAGNSIQLIDGQPEPFYFDHIFDQDVSNQTIFNTMAKQIVDAGLKGFNGTIFAYGQTSSGKTYTMMGDERNPGVMVLATKEIFKEIERATDREFLLRVGYIEIYNEKIYDLLNKSNQDLKIHETPNGEVNVNCSEYIITCEQDLLNYLCIGSKQRKIGETNMNERSSRSHAIFRIIIESRKTDKTDDDSVQISILNLVDLAGSERADQTGATGSRLKEGSHINKSLLFLSCVIKQLAEDKYVSYRDSKLTRILQASLGGNALTAIICTINPTAVEETLSTLNFANRAKVVKNKPQVNEILTDAAMMKRLEKEINRLQNELEVEKTKNSQIKVGQLQKRLNEEILKIISSNNHSIKTSSDKRRRTWCPSSATPPIAEDDTPMPDTCLPQPTIPSQIPTKLQLPRSHINFTPHITLRDEYYQQQLKEIACSPTHEEFLPAEEVFFDEVLTPSSSPTPPKMLLQTPVDSFKIRTASLTPRLTDKESLQKVERELKELEAFTNLEKRLNVEHDLYNTVKHQLEDANRIILRYEKEREEFAFAKVEHLETVTNLANCHKRCQELESKLTEFESKTAELEKTSQAEAERIVRHEQQITELKTKITQLEMENREAISLDYEFQQHKNKAKRRETELLDALEEKQKEINKLERSLQTLTTEVHNSSKEELQQLSKGHNNTDAVCVNCNDLQRILNENNQLTQDIDTLNLNLEKATADAESSKLRADYLETENTKLKHDVEQYKSTHGSLQDLQQQIAILHAEKCKLETVKIEFEVISKETASKIAEKINISHEIQTLSTQKDSLAAECDKLKTELTANESVKDELNRLRIENTALHSDLQTIKAKLEAAQSDYCDLMSENRNKSDSYEKLNMEVLSTRNLLQVLQNEYRDIQQKYEQIQAECNKHEGTIGEIQSEYDSIQNKYQCLQREYEKLSDDSVKSFADCDRVQNENESLETEIRELKFKVEEAQRKLMENDSLQLELESLRTEMNRLQDEYDMKRKSASPIKEESVDLCQENADLKQELNNLQQQFDDMQREYDDMSTKLVEAFAEYDSLQADNLKLEAELKMYREMPLGDHHLTDDLKTMKVEIEQLQANNSKLLKENIEWKGTVKSMTETLHEKCNEKEHLAAQLEEVKNESIHTQSPRKSIECSDQFLKLAQRLIEIDVPIGNGCTRTFRSADSGKYSANSKMMIGNISGITQGMFNGFRGAIEFAITTSEYTNCNDIYDSLEAEDNSTGANSCDSLEDGNKQLKDKEIKELTDEKSRLFERIRHLEETLSILKIENDKLTCTREQLDTTNRVIDQLKEEKDNLKAITEESKSKITELNEILSRAEYDNKKLMTDCENLQKAIESESAAEKVSRDIYEELKRRHEQLLQTSNDFEKQSAEWNQYSLERSQCQCEKYKEDVANMEEAIIQLGAQLDEANARNSESELPTRAELEKTIAELHAQLKDCKCVELQAALNEKNKLTNAENDITTTLAHDICVLQEQLTQQQCKCQEMQIEIIELRTSLEEKVQEFAECSAKFEDLNTRYTKLQTECEELQTECHGLQTTLDFERESSVKTIAALNEQQQHLVRENEKQREIKEQLDKHIGQLESEMKQLTEYCDIARSSERSLHLQLQKIVQDLELAVRDKEKLEREQCASKQQLEDVQNKFKASQSQVCNLNEKCGELEEDLFKVQTRKVKLQSELEEAEKRMHDLKETYKTEKQDQDEKYASLMREVEQLTETKKQLQLDLDEARERSEFLLQESKALDEQVNQELCTVRNSNNLMAQQIQTLQEQLTKAKDDLKAAQETINQEKDEQLAEITTKCTEIEEKHATIEKQLEEELNNKKLLEETSSAKDQIINELTAKQSKLEADLDTLNTQCNELKRTLATETHLKEVLEKAITERDDLIVHLTNNNNSLATNNSELEEKLAILGNQFDESKRHFSAEVNKLNQHVADANEKAANQIAKVDDLTNKISDLERDLKQAQTVTTERNSLLLKLDKLQSDYDALTIKHANLELTRNSFEAELNSARAVVVENTTLIAKMNDIQAALNEVQIKCDSLNSVNMELQASNVALTKQMEGISSKAEECQRLNEEMVTLRSEIATTKGDLISAKEEFAKNLADWESMKSAFLKQISQLQCNATTLTSERKSMQDKLIAAEKSSANRIAQLEQQIETLQKEHSLNMSKTISPRKEKLTTDLLMGENQQLKVKNMSLMDKLDSCQKSQNEERKNRRLSTHDERRLQSFWDINRDVSTMTDPTSADCNCSELDRKLTELKQKLLIRDSQVNTLSMELKNHPLKSQYETVKTLLIEEESKQQQLRLELKKYKQLAAIRSSESRHCNRCAEAAKRITLDSATQTIESDESECYRKLLSKYEDLKMICRVRHTKIKELEEALSKGKENAGENCPSLSQHQYKQKYELLKKEYKVMQEKYEEAKILCNHRYELLKNLPNHQSGNS